MDMGNEWRYFECHWFVDPCCIMENDSRWIDWYLFWSLLALERIVHGPETTPPLPTLLLDPALLLSTFAMFAVLDLSTYCRYHGSWVSQLWCHPVQKFLILNAFTNIFFYFSLNSSIYGQLFDLLLWGIAVFTSICWNLLCRGFQCNHQRLAQLYLGWHMVESRPLLVHSLMIWNN